MSKCEKSYMLQALQLAKQAAKDGEIPVGAVIVQDDKVIATGRNLCETKNNATLHAEILAIDQASEALQNWRLNNCTMYVTLEPCPMCMAAIISARISKVVFGAYNEKTGSCVSCMNVDDFPFSNKPDIIGGYLEHECKSLMIEFFKCKRK